MGVALHPRHLAAAERADGFLRRPARLEAATGAAGISVAVLVGIDGSPGWQAARVVAVAAVTAVVVASLQRMCSERWRGRVSVLTAIPALAIAVGFAPNLVKGGPLLIRAASIVLAIASLSLIVGGTVVATRQRRLVRLLLASAAVFVATGAVAFVIGPAVAATNVPRPEIDATPSDLGLVYEDLALRTSDGVTLAAWYVPSSTPASVVLLHGAGSTRSNVLDEAAVLAGAGFGVLMVDARGHGDSAGRAMDFGWHGDADIAAATTYLTTRPDLDRDRIGVVGLSMGGEEALGASGSNDLIRAVVAEGATARSAADEAWLSDEYGFRGLFQEALEHVQDSVTNLLTSASTPTSMRTAVAASRGTRYLLITAGNVADEGHAAEYIAAAASDRVQTWTVKGADHVAGLQTAPDEWSARVNNFLTEALLSNAN
jgi:dienelactone hydrolase